MLYFTSLLLAASSFAFANGQPSSNVQGKVLVMHAWGNEEAVDVREVSINSEDKYETIELGVEFKQPVIEGKEKDGYFLPKSKREFKKVSSSKLDSGLTFNTYKSHETSFLGLGEGKDLALHQFVRVTLVLDEAGQPVNIAYQVGSSVNPSHLRRTVSELKQSIKELEDVRQKLENMTEQQIQEFKDSSDTEKKEIIQAFLNGSSTMYFNMFRKTLADLQEYDVTGFREPVRFTASFDKAPDQ